MIRYWESGKKPTLPHQDCQSFQDVYRLMCMMLAMPLQRLPNEKRIPYGYVVSEEDKMFLVPDMKCVEVLVEAKLLEQEGQGNERKIADWITRETGKKLSGAGWRNISNCRPFVPEALLPYEEKLELIRYE